MSKLILTNEVAGLGSAGDVVEVKNGYARNYLIPQGFAVAWSRGGEKQVASIGAGREMFGGQLLGRVGFEVGIAHGRVRDW